MIRTIEVLLVIIIITGASIIASFFAFLPQPQQVSPINLRRLALTTLEMLDSDHDLSQTAFTAVNDPAWGQLQAALSASLPPNIVFNLTVYDASTGGTQLYSIINSISNAQSLGISSDVATYLVASSNATFNATPEKIGIHGGGTLYILNCSDSNGWWITGYTAQTLAQDLYNLLSPYFQATVMVQNTTQLGQILNGTKISNSPYENVTSAVVINTNGEAVPIPAGYYNTTGYDTVHSSYAKYCYMLGNVTNYYNWTWVSIVGYPLYYVSNTGLFPNDQNTWGIYGMKLVGSAGLNAFLRGLSQIDYNAQWWNGSQWLPAWWQDQWGNWIYDQGWITGDNSSDPNLSSVYLSSDALYSCNYYGIYPSPYQTATRALPVSILNRYNLNVTSYILQEVDNAWLPGAFYKHVDPNSGVFSGAFLALGLARTPDIRLTALGLLCGYKPRLFPSQYGAVGTSRLVVLQLGQVGGV